MALETHLWLRCETKALEYRSALTPTTAKELLNAGFKVTVEHGRHRIFSDDEFEKVGCTIAEPDSWPSAPPDAIIFGLKDLPKNDITPLSHTHIMFAHCYKQQGGWIDVLSRWEAGQPTGMLYDLEFLQQNGRRVAAFGYHAGFAGAAVGALSLAEQVEGSRLGNLTPYPNEEALIAHVKNKVTLAEAKLGRKLKALVIGALGRCGSGAIDLFRAVGLEERNIVKWDTTETAQGGPFHEIFEADIFVNCVYLTSKIPSFVDLTSIQAAGEKRNLRVVVDVSCDTTDPYNPIPIYDINTTFDEPTVDVLNVHAGPALTVVSIDHLPSLLPRESSEAFSGDLLPSLLQLPAAVMDLKTRQGKPPAVADVGTGKTHVWREAEALFWTKMAEMRSARSV